MPRPHPIDQPEPISVRVPGSLLRKVKLLLLNPVSGKVKYGAMAKLIQQLLTEWVEAREKDMKGKPNG